MSNVLPTAPLPTVRRLPLYLRRIRARRTEGADFVSSAALAAELGFDPVATRKDLAAMGVAGTPRLGFPAKELEQAIAEFLGWDNATDAVLCGVGSLGRALLGYSGFEAYGLRIVAAFDVNPKVVGTSPHGVKVFPLAKIGNLVPRLNAYIGILTVPPVAAKDVAARMAAAGIRGVWNFTHTELGLPPGIEVENVDLASSLAVLSHRLRGRI